MEVIGVLYFNKKKEGKRKTNELGWVGALIKSKDIIFLLVVVLITSLENQFPLCLRCEST